MLASSEADLVFFIPILLIFGPLMIGCLIAALVRGMSRDNKKRREGGKLLIIATVAGAILLASPKLVELLHHTFHE